MYSVKPAFPAARIDDDASYAHPVAWDSTVVQDVLPRLLAERARAEAGRPFIDFLGARSTYGDIFEEAGRFAAALKSAGIAKGERVGLFLPNVPAYVSAYYGAMMAGAVVVNFSPLYSAEELAHQVEDSGTRLLVTLDVPALLPTAIAVLDRSGLERLVVARLSDQLPFFKGIGLRLVKRKDIAKLPARADVVRWRDWLPAKPAEAEPLTPDDLALLQYTGGTTGRPKGAMLTHGNLSANAQQVALIDPVQGDEANNRIFGGLPMFHVFANTAVLNHAMVRGASIVLVPRFEPGQVLAEIRRTRPSGFPGVPTMYQALLDHPDLAKTDLSCLRICISGGAPLPAPLRERFEAATGCRLVEGYGLTESSGVISVNPYEGHRKHGTIGQPVPQTRAILLDKEDPSKLAGEGEPGELALAGPQVMSGYWNRPDIQDRTFASHHGERWLRTGDVAIIDEDGFLSIVDRTKDMISVGGFKVFPSRVEEVLVRHEAVKEALVIGVPDAYSGEAPRAYVSLRDGVSADGEALAAWANERLGKHERVIGVEIRDELPKTMIGKLDRKALRAELAAE
jgi:long-chain acyl-CoA synthetase